MGFRMTAVLAQLQTCSSEIGLQGHPLLLPLLLCRSVLHLTDLPLLLKVGISMAALLAKLLF